MQPDVSINTKAHATVLLDVRACLRGGGSTGKEETTACASAIVISNL